MMLLLEVDTWHLSLSFSKRDLLLKRRQYIMGDDI